MEIKIDTSDLIIKSIQQRKPLKEPAVSLKKILMHCKTEDYYKLCTDEILRSCKDVDDLTVFLLDPTDKNNILITVDGLTIFFDILSGYCEEEYLRDILTNMLKLRRLYSSINDISSWLRIMSSKQLKGLYSIEVSSDEQETVKKYIHEELKQRRLSSVVRRKALQIKSWVIMSVLFLRLSFGILANRMFGQESI